MMYPEKLDSLPLTYKLFYIYLRLILQESGQYKGVRLASGQDLFSDKLVLDPTFMVPHPTDPRRGTLEGLNLRDVKGKVARGICVTTSSLKPDIFNFLVVYPPRCKNVF